MSDLKNYFRYNVREYFEQYIDFSNQSVLDFGCNHGNFIRYTPHNEYTGIDINKQIIDINKTKYPQYQWLYYNGYNYMYNKKGTAKLQLENKYDVAVSFSVITHMYENEMLEVVDTLKKNCSKLLLSYYSNTNKDAYENICRYRNLKAENWKAISQSNVYYLKTEDFLWTFYNDEYIKSLLQCDIKETKYDTKTLLGMQKCLII